MSEQNAPLKKKKRGWLAKKLGWAIALMGADPGFRPWEEESDAVDETPPGQPVSGANKTPPSSS